MKVSLKEEQEEGWRSGEGKEEESRSRVDEGGVGKDEGRKRGWEGHREKMGSRESVQYISIFFSAFPLVTANLSTNV